MKIAVVGTGNVGGTLGRRWAKAGNDVFFCSRSPEAEKVQALLAASGQKACSTVLADGVARSEVVVLATPWPATLRIVDSAVSLAGKVVIDCTNPIDADLTGLSVPPGESAAEQIAEHARGARVVKAFNSVPSSTMDDPRFGAARADLLLCGDDVEAKRVVARLGEELGFEPVDCGLLAAARHLERLALCWIYLAFKQGRGSDFTFKILKR